MAYIAPEQIKGDPPVSHRTDLYTLGCVIFEMLTGKLPFPAETMAQLVYQHLEESPPRVATIALDCPVWLDALVNQLLDKDPLKRPHDAAAVAQALREARERALSGTGMAQAATSGPSALKVSVDKGDAKEVRELLGKKKKRKKKKGPIYERAWFLATCLLLVVVAGAWSFWPLNERQLFERAEPLMASNERVDWDRARKNFIEPMLERFPQGEHAAWGKEQIDRIEMAEAEKRLKLHAKRGGADSEAERLYTDAKRYEEFGDALTAYDKYKSIPDVVKAEGKERPFVLLARKRAQELMSQSESSNARVTLIQSRLDDADQLEQDGRRMDARKIWNSIVTLYADNRELQPLVEKAQEKLTGPKPAAESDSSGAAEAKRAPAPNSGAAANLNSPSSASEVSFGNRLQR
jgi:serine/threonine protein kinase